MKRPRRCAVRLRGWQILVLLAVLLAAAGAEAAGTEPGAPADRTRPITVHADLVTRLNPAGLMLTVGGFRDWLTVRDRAADRVSSYLRGGLMAGINPAYGQASAYVEWMPALFATLRLQSDLYGFLGTNGALLSFPEGDARFGADEIDALAGREERGVGRRFLVQPTIRAKAGPLIIRNQTDLARYRFDGKGPFFYEGEYDTLLKDGDVLLANRTDVLYAGWQRGKGAILLFGPFYEVTRADAADLTRQRLGAELFWIAADSLWSLDRPRIYSQAGVYRRDRNRQDEGFLALGCGFDLDL